VLIVLFYIAASCEMKYRSIGEIALEQEISAFRV